MAEGEVEEKVLSSYSLNAHGLPVEVRIVERGGFVPDYEVSFPGIGSATKLLLMSLRGELITIVPVDSEKLGNKEYRDKLNQKYVEASNVLIDRYLPGTDAETKKLLNSYVINIMLGLGDLEAPLADDSLEEITVNGAKDYIWVYHRKLGWCKTNIKPGSEESIYEQAEQIGRNIGREINNLAPLMDAELSDGSRVNATLFPISQNGNTLTIRKFAKNPWTMTGLMKSGTISANIAATVWLCIQNEISLLVAGGTASGKTSFLNAMSIFLPPNRRIISVEETRELSLPSFLQWLQMLTRSPNPEGKGAVSLYDLMINALRQRPDTIMIGEIRTVKDAETLFEAIHTGHSVYGTVHADNAQDTIIRMTNPPISVPKIVINALGAVIVQFRHRSKGIRRTFEFAEILRTGDANVMYRWDVREDIFTQVSDMTRLSETLSLYAGLTKREIDQDVAEKSEVLNWMVKNNVVDVDNAGLVIANYYKNQSRVMDIVRSDIKYSEQLFR
ncbi:MAG: type II/IV secretion system ATPase subunit [Candidatus Micrarchaeaceae archaeon]